jgi:hypothetical protein
MPAYISSAATQQVNALYPGGSILLVNSAATDANVTKTLQFAVGPVPNGNPRVTFVNTTNQDCPLEGSWVDTDADYQAILGCVVPAGSSSVINLQGGWVRGHFVTAPTSGSMVATA